MDARQETGICPRKRFSRAMPCSSVWMSGEWEKCLLTIPAVGPTLNIHIPPVASVAGREAASKGRLLHFSESHL